ncbi:MAG: GxxExxY protein [Dehalococcoidia bacterium]
MPAPSVPHDPATYAIIGAAMEVHRALGPGYLEAAYREALTFAFAARGIPFASENQEALALALGERGIPFAEEVPFHIRFHGRTLRKSYRADFVCFGRILVEIKALNAISSAEAAQLPNYRKVSGLEVGLLLNFGAPSLQYRRFVLTPHLDLERPRRKRHDEASRISAVSPAGGLDRLGPDDRSMRRCGRAAQVMIPGG